jgi:hypothetical protein
LRLRRGKAALLRDRRCASENLPLLITPQLPFCC